MRYSFVIDNRKCIGCHACTTACKSEHEVPVGVNRTWVKQVEKGTFPDTRRLFSVMRCNHCTDAPCVSICPTEALFTREDGIVDFDNDRCIGCKSCMQACPYDALYIDPETHTAAKCNYCAHRIDVGLEPACVNVCPEEAIISGDVDDPMSEISKLLGRHPVMVRKPEKGTDPNLFYIDGDDASLNPNAAVATQSSIWGSQALGVGHFVKEAEKMAFSNGDIVAEVLKSQSSYIQSDGQEVNRPSSAEVLIDRRSKAVYNTPDKGILWGWEVSGYIWTKAIAAGALLLPFIARVYTSERLENHISIQMIVIGMFFLAATGMLLIKDLDQPKRFLYVLLRPHFESWLVKGGYVLTIFGGILSALAVAQYFDFQQMRDGLFYAGVPTAILLAVYTAFLFGQAKGRDFWQSPILPIHMLVHALMGGAAVYLIMSGIGIDTLSTATLISVLGISLSVNVITILIELYSSHMTVDAKLTAEMITKGRYRKIFWVGVIAIGNVIPLIAIFLLPSSAMTMTLISILVLSGILITEHIWVEAPQRIPLS